MSADEVAQDMVRCTLRYIAPWGPGCWNLPIRHVWHRSSKNVATGLNANSLFR